MAFQLPLSPEQARRAAIKAAREDALVWSFRHGRSAPGDTFEGIDHSDEASYAEMVGYAKFRQDRGELKGFAGLYGTTFLAEYPIIRARVARGEVRMRRWECAKRRHLVKQAIGRLREGQTLPSADDFDRASKVGYADVCRRWPRLVAHVICASLGYATPQIAAYVVLSALQGQPCYCEWIDACYSLDPIPAVEGAFRFRRSHKGYMAEYTQARRIVDEYVATGRSPGLASWF